MNKFRLLLTGAMLAGLAFAQTPSHAAAIVALPGNGLTPYHSIVSAAGTELTFVNADALDKHNVVSRDTDNVKRPFCSQDQANNGTCWLFVAETIEPATGGSAPIVGTADLAAGTYEFYCSWHSNIQSGTLVVA